MLSMMKFDGEIFRRFGGLSMGSFEGSRGIDTFM
jgi:hypothetical protein